MIGHDDARLGVDAQIDLYSLGLESLYLAPENAGIQHHAGTDEQSSAKDGSAGNQVELVLLAFHDHGMPRVVSALEADDDVVVFGQQIYYLALALIPKLRAGEYREHGV
ncbi:Uncharacterised protein [uncultured archaeon]|nr:Uncharacterised protein [uncultured archaeon]